MSRTWMRGALCAAVVALCACQVEEGSDTSSVIGGENMGRVIQKDDEVFIYYANESRPTDVEKANVDKIAALMDEVEIPYVKEAVQRLRNDSVEFPRAADQDVAELTAAICNNQKNKRLALMIFTNRTSRLGSYQYCQPGRKLITVDSADIRRVSQRKDVLEDFRYASNPNAHPDLLQIAIKIARAKFAPERYSFSIVMKAHGGEKNAISIRMPTRYDVIEAEPNGKESFKKAIERLALQKTKERDDAFAARYDLQPKLLASLRGLPQSAKVDGLIRGQEELYAELKDAALKDGALKDGALKDGALKDGALKDGALKDGALKDGALKDAALKDAALKDAALKDALLKDAVLKDYVLKDAILKDAILKDGILKDYVLKSGILAAEEDYGDELIAKASKPDVGISKQAWLKTFALVDSTVAKERMNFNTVFMESCKSYLTWDDLAAVGKDQWNPNIGQLFVSDEHGLDSYRTIDYAAFLRGVSFQKPFAPQLAAWLEGVSDKAHGGAATRSPLPTAAY